jgi:hypothetical protein
MSQGFSCKCPESKKTILSLGYKDRDGHIVVTDVLCGNFPELTQDELASLSWNLCQWASMVRQKKINEDHPLELPAVQ